MKESTDGIGRGPSSRGDRLSRIENKASWLMTDGRAKGVPVQLKV